LNGREVKVKVERGRVPRDGSLLRLREKGGGMPKKVREVGEKKGGKRKKVSG